ncbi:hypothetical protein MKEN_00942400 [Mycena kentingensis (nom. inval.)]|nr:hypothetical protein MKEN_00942400 [Mycena kentingensis (nom. inval.)]
MSLADSPFNDKVDSFFVPTDEELVQIRTLLVDPVAESAKLDAEIANMEMALAALRSRRDALNDEIAIHQSLLAPIRRIPQHALEEIFLACLPTSHNAVIDPSEAPLLLGRICRYWRELAYNTPTLWNNIHISGLNESLGSGYYSGPHSPAPVPVANRMAFSEVVRRWLSRSHASPLSISFTESPGPAFFPEDRDLVRDSTAQLVMPQLHAVCERIHSLEISADLTHWELIFALDMQSLPSLRRCAVFDMGYGNTALEQCPIFAHPRLDSVAMSGCCRALELACPWANLLQLSLFPRSTRSGDGPLGGLSFNGACTLLSQCPRLEGCTMEITQDEPLTWNPSSTLSLLHLFELALRISYGPFGEATVQSTQSLIQLLQLLLLPALRSLKIGNTLLLDGSGLVPGLHVALVTPFTDAVVRGNIIRELPKITSLHIDLIPLSPPATPPAPTPASDLFTMLEDENLCPELRFLSIKADTSNIEPSGLVPFVESRLARGTLASLRVWTTASVGKFDVDEDLRKVAEKGLEVDIGYPKPPVAAKWKYNPRKGLRRAPDVPRIMAASNQNRQPRRVVGIGMRLLLTVTSILLAVASFLVYRSSVSMPALVAARAFNAAHVPTSYTPVAIFVGGTSGIGQGMAQAFAQHTNGNASIILIGRNRAAAEGIIAGFPKPTKEGVVHEFVECDMTLMKNVGRVAGELRARFPKINFLSLSTGVMTMNGRNETEEGIDRKLAVHYYGRWKFIRDLIPSLEVAKTSGQDAKVISVLSAGHGRPIDLNDLGLKKSFSVMNAAAAATTYNDIMVQDFAQRYPQMSFGHSYPGGVKSGLFKVSDSRILRLADSVLMPILSPLLHSVQEAGEYQLHGLLKAGAGAFRSDDKGDDISWEKAYYGGKEAMEKLWKHTEEETTR